MTYREHMRACRRRYWRGMLKRHAGCMSQLARAAGISRAGLYRLLARDGIYQPAPRGNDAWRALQ